LLEGKILHKNDKTKKDMNLFEKFKSARLKSYNPENSHASCDSLLTVNQKQG
jgi:hypothetical protein